MEERAISVSKLSTYIKQIFEAEELLFNIRVYGEISGFQIRTGIAYFTLKDENASLSCVCFNAEEISEFKNGDLVVVTGTPRYYVKGGKLNFQVSSVELAGQGILYQKFIELKNRLEEKGYFLPELKKPLPSQINRVGVVTSPEGAVVQDIINVIRRRNKSIDIIVFPTKVQGAGAEIEIAKGISFFDNYDVDVIIVARGGGSMEDLQPFNTEAVADAIFRCNKPLVSAVGHETDFTICDFCADVRASTPSVAAELVSLNVSELKQRLIINKERLSQGIYKYIDSKTDVFNEYKAEIIDAYDWFLDDNIKLLLQNKDKFGFNSSYYLNSIENKLTLLNSGLVKLNPSEILKLGYACVKNVNTINDIRVGDSVETILVDGRFTSVVKSINGEKNEL